jgi:serine phosphatase RsbU (regulator of sigma subunit)
VSRIAIREAIRVAAAQGRDPAETLVHAHRVLRRHYMHDFATAIVGYLDVREHSLEFANAGHPPPLMCGEGGATFLDFAEHGLPLGIEEAVTPALHRVEVPASSLLVFYTDGVTEHDRKPLTGAAELHDAVIFAYNFASLPSAGVIERQMGLANGTHDDAAILTAWTPPELPETASLHLERASYLR